MILPNDFERRMQDMLGEAYPAFLASYEKEKFQALRLNPAKVDKESFLQDTTFHLTQVPWEQNGFSYTAEDQPGKHPYHEAGAYYIQEPSAMSPAAYLEAKPGEKILDLCAAPGGKTTQIAGYMQGKGLLVCNEIHPQRAKILSENVERMGIPNALVTNEAPAKLASLFDGFFDRILVDAPCSGEGMFRKNEEACKEWSPDNVVLCANRQDEILDAADSMLRAGGRLVYSTCTFAPMENEGTIARFLERHPDYEILEVPLFEGMAHGKVEWCDYDRQNVTPVSEVTRTIRLWPHLLNGEGHFLAVLKKNGEVPDSFLGFSKNGFEKVLACGGKKPAKELELFLDFQKQNLKVNLLDLDMEGVIAFGEQLYLVPRDMPSLKGLKVLRPGLHLGTCKKDRFEPGHALALFLKKEEALRTKELTMQEALQYLNGQTLSHDGEKGWYVLTVGGYSLGWGKLAGQIMKNHYPKGLRSNYI